MKLHSNARMVPSRRVVMVEAILREGLSWKRAAARCQRSERTVAKWVARYREAGRHGMGDRSSGPKRSARGTSPAQVAVVLTLREMRLPGFQIARQSGLSRATISRLLRRHGLAKLSALDPAADPPRRYQREHPGELLHLDIKKLGRIVRPSHRLTGNRRDRVAGAGWESMFMSPSTMLPGSPAPKSCPMKAPRAHCASSAMLWPPLLPWASKCSVS